MRPCGRGGGAARMSDMDIPERLAPAFPGEWPGKERLAVFEAYRAELGLTADEFPMTHNRVNEGVSWWNAGAPELGDEPSLASRQLAYLDAFIADGGTVADADEYRALLWERARWSRIALYAPRPDRPRSPRSKHATTAAEAATPDSEPRCDV